MLPSILLLLSSALASPPPLLLQHQGHVQTVDGLALSGVHRVTVTLYDDADGVAALWVHSEDVVFENGFFVVTLGSQENNPLFADLFEGDLYLGFAIDDGQEIGPPEKVKSVPWSIYSGTAVNVDGGTVNAERISINGNEVINSDGEWVGPDSLGQDGADGGHKRLIASQAHPPGSAARVNPGPVQRF